MWRLNKVLLTLYLRYHQKYHSGILARLAIPMFNGLHPTNVFNFRSEFFMENVNKNDIVLDVACGTGLVLKRISPLIARGYGIG